ncbi:MULTISPECIES: hypothetical protein [Bacillus]|uniref:hypothetical protein n=1 Tax=Bacillus TaxID=1386 RepID=UPI00030B692C|nr:MULTISPECIES: hypothetical protein [Bacillus]
MIENQTYHIQGYEDFDLTYTLLKNDSKSNKLAILLPGWGYTTQKPLFHYITGIYLNSHYDVLQVNYKYDQDHFEAKSKEEFITAIKYDTNAAISHLLANSTNNYEQFNLIGKSIGTIALSDISQKDIFRKAKLIWLTPLLKIDEVFQSITNRKQKSFCIIGDADPNYNTKRFNTLKTNSHIRTKLIPGVNHSLEYDHNVIASIKELKKIIIEIDEFKNAN